jgi:peptidylprolyl isomerase
MNWKLLGLIFIIIGVIAVSGCTQNAANNNTSTKIVATGDTVSVDYTGSLENGTVFDSSIGRASLEFVAGAGQMIKGFDDAVIGMKEGDEKTVTIAPENAYGLKDPANVIDIPIGNVPNTTKVGDTLYGANGQQVKVVAINSTTVTIDMNHFLAGKTLIFKIKMLKITKAE